MERGYANFGISSFHAICLNINCMCDLSSPTKSTSWRRATEPFISSRRWATWRWSAWSIASRTEVVIVVALPQCASTAENVEIEGCFEHCIAVYAIILCIGTTQGVYHSRKITLLT